MKIRLAIIILSMICTVNVLTSCGRKGNLSLPDGRGVEDVQDSNKNIEESDS